MLNFPLAPSEIKEKTINQRLASTGLTLRSILKKHWPNESSSQMDREISTLANVKKIKWIAISECWSKDHKEEKRSALKLNFFHAKLYYLCAKIALKKGNTDEAWSYLSYSTNLIGFLEGYKYNKEEENLKKSRASKGGKTLQLKKLQINGKIRELLENPPKGGWKSESSTIDEILSSQDLKEFISTIGAERTITDLREFITSEIVLNSQNQEKYKKLRSK
ncbi:hypothetical protein [Pseudomonas sp. URMO17WK12:I2]|uniref:hypothetical protein n=1 Tax=Pseudomonas sp. URMO17WK12:I2 TaxID=1261623 RepID=UPI000DB69138|nr:hypothetical protein [Pseudomonas sp. URMO17WK12:I2]PZW40207.1 hypothetical protein F469_04656 [Pseudomonas sp. URMO17WK12:I2]